jgi:uncharacterized protein (DUF2141 family)
MSKVRVGAVAVMLAGAMALPGAGRAASAGPFGSVCSAANEPAMLVRVTGFKVRTGTIRVQSYGGDPDRYFDKGTYLKRIEVPVPSAGALEVCMPVAAPGRYAVSVRHDVNGAGKADKSSGGGMSGNPHMSLFDVVFKRKPSPEQVAVDVGHGVRVVPVTLNYLIGGSFRPVEATG